MKLKGHVGQRSLFPIELTHKTLYKVCHRLISTACLLLIVACFVRFALFAGKEAIREAFFHVLSTLEVSSLSLHSLLLCLVPLPDHFTGQKVSWLHSDHVECRNLFIKKLSAHVRVLDQNRHH